MKHDIIKVKNLMYEGCEAHWEGVIAWAEMPKYKVGEQE